jgi:hypothetical protein
VTPLRAGGLQTSEVVAQLISIPFDWPRRDCMIVTGIQTCTLHDLGCGRSAKDAPAAGRLVVLLA